MCLILTGDGHTDLQALVQYIEKDAEQSGRVLTDVTVGDYLLRVGSLGTGRDGQISLPQVIGEDLVMLVGTDLEQQAAWFLEPQAPWEPDEEFVGAQMGARVDWEIAAIKWGDSDPPLISLESAT